MYSTKNAYVLRVHARKSSWLFSSSTETQPTVLIYCFLLIVSIVGLKVYCTLTAVVSERTSKAAPPMPAVPRHGTSHGTGPLSLTCSVGSNISGGSAKADAEGTSVDCAAQGWGAARRQWGRRFFYGVVNTVSQHCVSGGRGFEFHHALGPLVEWSTANIVSLGVVGSNSTTF